MHMHCYRHKNGTFQKCVMSPTDFTGNAHSHSCFFMFSLTICDCASVVILVFCFKLLVDSFLFFVTWGKLVASFFWHLVTSHFLNKLNQNKQKQLKQSISNVFSGTLLYLLHRYTAQKQRDYMFFIFWTSLSLNWLISLIHTFFFFCFFSPLLFRDDTVIFRNISLLLGTALLPCVSLFLFC